ncbi:arginine-binding periplasmic protein 2 [Salmonella enterica subsp. enterica]|nr:arginine-binding periplasmic protein 2 [Salmonella enterica subsp. enterica]
MKKLVLAALLASFATGSIAAEKNQFRGFRHLSPPFESLDASNKIVGFDHRSGNRIMQANAGRMYFYQSCFR